MTSEIFPTVPANNINVEYPEPHSRYQNNMNNNPIINARNQISQITPKQNISHGRTAPRFSRLQLEIDEESKFNSTSKSTRRFSLGNNSSNEKSIDDIFSATVSPFKPDYDIIISKLQSIDAIKELTKIPLRTFSPTSAHNPENQNSKNDFHEFIDVIENDAFYKREGSTIFSSTLQNQNFEQLLSSNNIPGNCENNFIRRKTRQLYSPSCKLDEKNVPELEESSTRRKKSEMNVTLNLISNRTIKRDQENEKRNDDIFTSPINKEIGKEKEKEGSYHRSKEMEKKEEKTTDKDFDDFICHKYSQLENHNKTKKFMEKDSASNPPPISAAITV